MNKLLMSLPLALVLITTFASAAGWPPETGAKVVGNALEVLEATDVSLEKMLNDGAHVVSSYVAQDGPVVTVLNKKHYAICMLKGAGMGSDQNVATSKCYVMN